MNNYKKDKLSKNANAVLDKVKLISRTKDFSKINGLFLIKALVNKKGSLGEFIINNLIIEKQKLPTNKEIQKLSVKFSVKDVLVKAFQVASTTMSPYVGTEHLFHALLIFLIDKESAFLDKYFKKDLALSADKKFNQKDPDLENQNPQFMNEMQAIIENFFSPQTTSNGNKSALKEFSTNLNEITHKEKHILVGRNNELERISNILGRRTKNNPVLIGEPGVGKTAVVEGLAQKINQGKASYYLNNKQILNLDLGLMIAGTNFRGEFEARLKQIIKEASNNKSVVLFIDEIHTLVGAGNAMGGMDASNLLKPALSRGEIQIIGATTLDEYRKYIEKDPALERRFQPIFVNEPSIKETEKILMGIRSLYEKYHNIKITPNSIKLASSLAKRYFPSKFLPDSAIDLIDESSAKKRTSSIDLKIYKKLNRKKEALKKITKEKEILVASDRYERAILMRNKEQKIKKEIANLRSKIQKIENNNPIKLKNEDIVEVVSEATKIPLDLLSEKTASIPNQAKKLLTQEIIGQEKIIQEIYNTLLRRSSGISNPNQPLGSFLFIGASGVGKTLTAKILAKSLSPTRSNNLIQINMSEFMEKHSISKFLGAPAGYVGYDEDKSLVEKIRQNPYSVVLFDEIEKADRNILNILLQILDEGKITDSKGRLINFKNSLIILTSNIGTSELNRLSKLGFSTEEKTFQNKTKLIKKEVEKKLQENLSPELLNRLDSILIFNHLSSKDLKKIAEKEIKHLKKRLKNKKIKINIPDKKIASFIVDKKINPNQGARLIKKELERNLEPLIAEKIIQHNSKDIKVSLEKNKIKVS